MPDGEATERTLTNETSLYAPSRSDTLPPCCCLSQGFRLWPVNLPMNPAFADRVVLILTVAVPLGLIAFFVLALILHVRSVRQKGHVPDTRRRLRHRLCWVGASVAIYAAVLPFALAFLIAGIGRRPIPWSFNPEHKLKTDQTTTTLLGKFAGDPKTAVGLPFEDVQFLAVDGRTLRGWFVPGDPAASTAIVAVHVRAADRRVMLSNVPFFHDRGYPVLLFDCRNHGASDGDGTGVTFGVHESQDVQSAVRFLKSQRRLRRVVAFGASQGAASVIMAAGSDPEIDGVIASAPYRNMQDLVDAGQILFGYPDWFGQIVTLVSNWRLGLVDRDGSWTIVGEPPVLSPIAAVSRISPRPLLLMHGTSDAVISFHASEDLFIRAKDPKSLWLCSECPP